MIEREQGRERRGEKVETENTFVSSEVAVEPGQANGDDVKAQNAAFLAALEMVMVDHHNVLAALAK